MHFQSELERFYGVENGAVHTETVSVDLRAEPNSNVAYTVVWTTTRHYGLVSCLVGVETQTKYYIIERGLNPEIVESSEIGCS